MLKVESSKDTLNKSFANQEWGFGGGIVNGADIWGSYKAIKSKQ